MTHTTTEAMLDKAVDALKRGGVVAFPTDTLYGLGACIFFPDAVKRVYQIKGRDYLQPLPVLLAKADDLPIVAGEISEEARLLAKRFWPGALTLVVKKSSTVPDVVTAGRPTVALRVPAHPLAQELIRRLAAPITGTSANPSGDAPPVTADQVRHSIGHLVDVVVDGGPVSLGVASTIVDVTLSPPKVLRVGAIPIEAIDGVLKRPSPAKSHFKTTLWRGSRGVP